MQALDESSNPHVKLITKVALATGGRWGECEGLKTQQVRAGRVQFAQTKSKKTRAVPISQELADAIEAHATTRPKDTDRLFDSSYGAFLKALERAGLPLPEGQASHVLRHTFASHFMINGGNILTLQRVLGHASLTMTMRYAHLAPDHMQEVLALNPLANPGRKSVGSSKKKAPNQKS
ncbi:MAG: Tyrosine recombinase XerD [Xylophilus sp.]|nr:MAG: Tyrosine recombinase XerD [Xylophilus sp.]